MSTETHLLDNRYSTVAVNVLRPVAYAVGYFGLTVAGLIVWASVYIATYEVLHGVGVFEEPGFEALVEFGFNVPFAALYGAGAAIALRYFGYPITRRRGAVLGVGVFTLAYAGRFALGAV